MNFFFCTKDRIISIRGSSVRSLNPPQVSSDVMPRWVTVRGRLSSQAEYPAWRWGMKVSLSSSATSSSSFNLLIHYTPLKRRATEKIQYASSLSFLLLLLPYRRHLSLVYPLLPHSLQINIFIHSTSLQTPRRSNAKFPGRLLLLFLLTISRVIPLPLLLVFFTVIMSGFSSILWLAFQSP